MTAEARLGTINKETWRDWMPAEWPEPAEDQLMTRPEFLERLRYSRGIDLTEARLVEWEQYGILPRPVRQRHEGANRVVYPSWVASLIEMASELKSEGKRKAEIRDYLQQEVRPNLSRFSPYWTNMEIRHSGHLLRHLRDDMRQLLMFYRHDEGRMRPVSRATLVFTDNEGNESHRIYFALKDDDGFATWDVCPGVELEISSLG